MTISVADEAKHGHTIASTVTVTLKDGRALTRHVDSFKGTPEQPLDRAEMRDKFLLLTKACDRRRWRGCSSGCRISKANTISTGSRSTRRKSNPAKRPHAAAHKTKKKRKK